MISLDAAIRAQLQDDAEAKAEANRLRCTASQSALDASLTREQQESLGIQVEPERIWFPYRGTAFNLKFSPIKGWTINYDSQNRPMDSYSMAADSLWPELLRFLGGKYREQLVRNGR